MFTVQSTWTTDDPNLKCLSKIGTFPQREKFSVRFLYVIGRLHSVRFGVGVGSCSDI